MEHEHKQRGRRVALVLGIVAALACGGCEGFLDPDSPTERKAIGASGGTIINGRASVTIPAGALSEGVTLEVREAADVPAGVIGPAFELLPDGQTFEKPVVIRLGFDPDVVPAGVDPGDLLLARLTDGVWLPLPGSLADLARSEVIGETTHFSSYGVGVGCDDADPCTDDAYVPGTGCVHTPLSCDDDDLCTLNERCENGQCVSDPLVCDPPPAGRVAVCDPDTGTCSYPALSPWAFRALDRVASAAPSIAVKADGTVVVVYTDEIDDSDTKIAWFQPTGELETHPMALGFVSAGRSTGLAVHDGLWHLFRYGFTPDLVPSMWYEIEGPHGYGGSQVKNMGQPEQMIMVIDALGGVHVVSETREDGPSRLELAYTHPFGATQIETLEADGPAMFPALAVDADNTYLVYVNEIVEANVAMLRFGVRPIAGADWHWEEVAELPLQTDRGTALALDPSGGVHIVFPNAQGRVAIAHRTGGPWLFKTDAVGEGRHVRGSTLAADSAGNLHLAYIDSLHGVVRYASRPPEGVWYEETVAGLGPTGAAAGGVSGEVAMAVVGDDVHLVFSPMSEGDLTHAMRSWR